MLECEIYPVWGNGKRYKERQFVSSEEQKHLNTKNRRKNLVRLLNANFTSKDIWITVGYRNGQVPSVKEEAERDVKNYMRRLSRICKKQGLPKLLYVYVTEFDEEKRMHHHIVTNFPDRDLAEQKWGKGEYPQARRLQPNDFGLEGLARYIGKDPKGTKTYGCSLGLYKSWHYPKISDNKITRRTVERLDREELDSKEYFEMIYKNYIFTSIEKTRSDYVGGVYLYVKMRRRK